MKRNSSSQGGRKDTDQSYLEDPTSIAAKCFAILTNPNHEYKKKLKWMTHDVCLYRRMVPAGQNWRVLFFSKDVYIPKVLSIQDAQKDAGRAKISANGQVIVTVGASRVQQAYQDGKMDAVFDYELERGWERGDDRLQTDFVFLNSKGLVPAAPAPPILFVAPVATATETPYVYPPHPKGWVPSRPLKPLPKKLQWPLSTKKVDENSKLLNYPQGLTAAQTRVVWMLTHQKDRQALERIFKGTYMDICSKIGKTDLDSMGPKDVEIIFDAIDKWYYEGLLKRAIHDRGKLTFEIEGSKKCAGHAYANSTRNFFIIRINAPLLLTAFRDSKTPIIDHGFICRTVIELTIGTLLHEIIHTIGQAFVGDICGHNANFLFAVKNMAGHYNQYHQLKTLDKAIRKIDKQGVMSIDDPRLEQYRQNPFQQHEAAEYDV